MGGGFDMTPQQIDDESDGDHNNAENDDANQQDDMNTPVDPLAYEKLKKIRNDLKTKNSLWVQRFNKNHEREPLD